GTYRSCPVTARNCPKLAGASRSCSQAPGSARNCSKLPGTARHRPVLSGFVPATAPRDTLSHCSRELLVPCPGGGSRDGAFARPAVGPDRKSTRLNSSHV